jgi:hypothetical protein
LYVSGVTYIWSDATTYYVDMVGGKQIKIPLTANPFFVISDSDTINN